MTDQPPRADIGDEYARQLGYGNAQSMVEADNTPGLADGLRESRTLIQQEQERGAKIDDFVQGSGKRNIEAVEDFSTRPKGFNPVNMLQTAVGMRQGQRQATSNSIERQKAATEMLMGFLGNVASNLETRRQEEESKAFKEREMEMRERELGMKYNKETGEFEQDEGDYDTPEGEPLNEDQQLRARLTGASAVSEVLRQGGGDFIEGRSKEERIAIAEQILQSGGVDSFKKSMPLDALLNDRERKDITEQTNLLLLLDQTQRAFEGQEGMGGTGPLAQHIFGFAASEQTREMRRLAENVKSAFAKAISGATISDKEMKRLNKFLPTSSKTETENYEDVIELMRGIQANQKLFELAKQEGLTANQAYEKYGDMILDQYGVKSMTTEDDTSSLVDKYWKE